MINRIVLECSTLGPVDVTRAHGVEAMNALPRFRVDVLSSDGALDLAPLIGADAALAFADEEGGERRVPLLVSHAFYVGAHKDGFRYALNLSARVSPLVLRCGYRVFQDQTTQEIVAEVLEDAGVPSAEVAWRLSGRYGKRVHCVQYGETDWAFVTRLLADEGCNYWFDQKDEEKLLLVVGDSASSHDSIPGEITVLYNDRSGMVGSAATFSELEHTYELAVGAVHVRDYDVRHPDSLIEGKAGKGPLEHYEFPASVLHADAAQARAKARLEQLRRWEVRATARSACARLVPGRVVRIDGASDDVCNGEYLIVEIEHTITQGGQADSAAMRPYANRAILVPFGKDRYHRPDLPRGAPRVDGLETATVTGPGGEEIHVDDLGCIKVRFPWDRSGIGDDKSSRWVRCLQMSMQGSMLLPRVGWEVPIVYVDGNPDLPFALGRLYNGAAPVPYGLPGKMATSTLQSATSPSDGTTHEVRLADDAGGMEAFIHATRDQSVSVGGAHTVKVGASRTEDVKKSHILTVHGAQSTTISNNQTLIVGADNVIVVNAARAESIGGMESVRVTGTYSVDCKGHYGEAVGGFYGLECNQSNTTVEGSFTQTVAGAMLTSAGIGTNNSVALARMEDVGGSRSYTVLASYADTTMGAKKIKAGASSDDAGTDVTTSVTGLGVIKAGSASFKAAGPCAVEASRISIQCSGTITAKGGATLTLGGNVKVSGGKAKFEADKTKKTDPSKVG
jgi:type VI secretion system secreted protein VgrG